MRCRILWFVGVLACLVAGGCSSPTSSSSATTTTIGSSTTTSTTASIVAPPVTDPSGQHRFTLYWMRNCDDPEHAVEVSACRIASGESRLSDQENVPVAALHALLDGPDDIERLNGLTTNLRNEAQLQSVTVEGDTATVAFNRYFETAKTRPQTAQVVFTLTQFPTIKKVRITVDGTPNGAIGAGDLTRANVNEFTPSIMLVGPDFNAPVAPSFKITGAAKTDAGIFDFRVTTPDNVVLIAGTVKIIASPGTSGTFLEPVKLPPGTRGPVFLITTDGSNEIRTPLTVA